MSVPELVLEHQIFNEGGILALQCLDLLSRALLKWLVRAVLQELALELAREVTLVRLLTHVEQGLNIALELPLPFVELDEVEVLGLLAEVVARHVVLVEFGRESGLLIPQVLVLDSLV